MQPNSWCRNLSNSVRLEQRWDGQLGYQPCCWMSDSIPVSTKENLIQARQQFENLVMSDKEKYCSECIRRESIGKFPSHRQLSMKRVPNDAESGDVNVLELQVDTVCNAACTICGPKFSSLWRKQLKIIDINADDNYKKLYNMVDVDKLTYINLLGGEPTISDGYFQLLDSIPHPENTVLKYNTNGSVFPDENTQRIWSKYKKILMIFSIDDMHDRFSYVRWPLRWNKIDQNFQYFLNNLKNANVSINCTVNAMSVYYLDQLQAWSAQCGNRTLKFSKCFGPWGLSACPESVRTLVREKLGASHEICTMLDQDPADEQHTQELIKQMDQLDSQRGTNWRETFAEIQHYF